MCLVVVVVVVVVVVAVAVVVFTGLGATPPLTSLSSTEGVVAS